MMEDEDSIGKLTSSFCDPLMEDAVATNRMLLPLINDESIDNDLNVLSGELKYTLIYRLRFIGKILQM